jgi:hemerythrin
MFSGVPMPLMIWDEEFSVNIEAIDEQHKKWVDILNELHDAMSKGRGADNLSETLDRLVEYTKVHFKTEERMLEKNGYPFYEGHKKIHDDMIKEVELLRLRLDSGERSMSVDVMQFLKNWLSDHILRTDKNFGPFLNSKGIK